MTIERSTMARVKIAITIALLVCVVQLCCAGGYGKNDGYGYGGGNWGGGGGYGGYGGGYGGYGGYGGGYSGYGKGYGGGGYSGYGGKASASVSTYLDPKLAYYIPYPVPLPPIKHHNNYYGAGGNGGYGGFGGGLNWLWLLLLLPFLFRTTTG